MTEPEDLEEDLFADLYDGDDNTAPAPPAPTAATSQLPAQPMSVTNESTLRNEAPAFGEEPDTAYTGLPFENNTTSKQTQGGNAQNGNQMSGHDQNHNGDDVHMDNEPFGSGIKEDGKMFIGGLNWETTDQSLRDYFSQFGEVQECTVMRDGATGRSRGFGFLTFKDAKTVNTVMVKEHYLDGKIIDPKRAIPRDEQEKTSKIFVGGVSQEATEQDFKEFFMQFGRVVDATLMMDKDTGRPRGFGFVTFDGEAAVDRCLEYHPLEILGKPIEVKKAQPRGKMGEEDDSARGGRGRGKFGRDDNRFGNDGGSQSNQGGQNGQAQGGMMGASVGGMTPQMMAQYWQRMQQYFAMMQQQMASAAMGGGMGAMAMGPMNPQLMAQMQQMQQMQQIQKMQNQQQGNMSPAPQSPGTQGMPNMANMQGMNPQMQQQMMQQMQMMQPGGMSNMNVPTGPSGAPTGPGMGANRPAYNAQDQLAFEQRKYEQQQARRAQMEQGGVYQNSSFAQQQGPQSGGATSWEGMYDDVPPPHNPNPGGRGSAGVVRNLTPSNAGPGKVPKGPATPQPSAAPANAPTGPKNAGVPGANFRNRGGRGGGGRFHPYGR